MTVTRWWVIVAAVILVAISLPHLASWTRQDLAAKVAADLRTLQIAVESFYIQRQKTYPAPTAAWQTALMAARPRVIRQPLTDPYDSTKAPYRYATSHHGVYYVIWSVGPDHTSGITGITDSGTFEGTPGDDLYVSNGTSGAGGF